MRKINEYDKNVNNNKKKQNLEIESISKRRFMNGIHNMQTQRER